MARATIDTYTISQAFAAGTVVVFGALPPVLPSGMRPVPNRH
jgi:hypothetical protein